MASDRGLPGHPQGIAMSLAGAGTTAASLIRDALGPAAITDCRLQKVERREEAVWVIATAIIGGFSFEPRLDNEDPRVLNGFVPAYRWHSGPSGQFATDVLAPERFVAAVQAAAHRFPEGPVFARSGVGLERWASVALDRGLALAGHPQGIAISLAGAGTTAATLIRDALGPAAITDGRLQKVERRDEAVWIIATAIADGFSFEPGWTVRIQEFGRTTRYSFNWMGLRGWANRFANGDLRSLIEEAQQLASDTQRNPE